MKLPTIIQGGMGAGVSSWRLARCVSMLGQLGVVSGTALDEIMARRLQDGDQGGNIRRALAALPFPRMAKRILREYYIEGGRVPASPYRQRTMHTIEGARDAQEMCLAANFVEVYLAREGHAQPVGINYLEKIQLPHLPSLYGAILAGVSVVIVGAGIPLEIPAAMEALAADRPAEYTLYVSGQARPARTRLRFDPAAFHEAGIRYAAVACPAFMPIVSSATLATMLYRRIPDAINGFVVENNTAGGHNAPPRGPSLWARDGQPLYGTRDAVDPAALRALERPFWLAGSYGSPEGLQRARAAGAAGIQIGTAFALCVESDLVPDLRRALIRRALEGRTRIYTDARASPTGFPFKVAEQEGTLSESSFYRARRRVCNLGFLRTPYVRADGSYGYRCAAEPATAYRAKGGREEELAGRKCLCNALVANIGMGQVLADGTREPALVTLGDDFAGIVRFCHPDNPDYHAADVLRVILETEAHHG